MGSTTWIRVETTQAVSRSPCQVVGIIVTPDSATNDADIILYDGESASDPQLIKIRSGAGTSNMLSMSPPLICHRGLYYVKGSNVEDCLIQYEPLKA